MKGIDEMMTHMSHVEKVDKGIELSEFLSEFTSKVDQLISEMSKINLQEPQAPQEAKSEEEV